jgi:broad specificity phosphatase PhoE
VNELWLARHGETEWSLSRQHTSVTDIDLTSRGVAQARELGRRLAGQSFDLVLSSPYLRARRSAEVAGFSDRIEIVEDLVEYHYGDYEGRTTAEIRRERPDWNLWAHGCPGGETTEEVARRADRVLERVRAASGTVVAFGHGHMSRVLAARYLGLEGADGGRFILATATLSILGEEHGRPAVRLWNDDSHLREGS